MTKKPSQNSKKSRNRLLITFVLVMVVFFALTLRLGYHQIVMGSDYAQRALVQQTLDKVVAAARGDIVDCNGESLAISSTTYVVWVRPDTIKNSGKSSEDKEAKIQKEAETLSEILNMDYDEVYETITSDKKLVKLAKKVDMNVAEELRAAKLTGLELVQADTRTYPLGNFASHVLGMTNDDNDGMTGIELYYNEYLAGLNGRSITSKDNKANELSYGTNKYYSAQDGYTLNLTIDSTIQYILEQKLSDGLEMTDADKLLGIVMDPKTGEIKGMAQTGGFDPNNPREPLAGDEEEFSEMTSEEKVNYWNSIWRNSLISDLYEPGSTFKLMTTAIALDEAVTDENEIFNCEGSVEVADWTIHCWNYPAKHGKQTLAQAVANSCNVTMTELVKRIGLDKYIKGLEGFGITAKTGIDYPGEAANIVHSGRETGPVELATMSYGQGVAVTPISMITAISSLANDGKVMKPHFLKELTDQDGNVVQKFEPEVQSISTSEQTAKDILKIMEDVVSQGGAGSIKIPGYRIGGKTGTANKPIPGGYSETDVIASFIGVAPIDDPLFTVLIIVDNPKKSKFASTTAGPIAKSLIQEIFQYLNIEPEYTEAEKAAMESSYTKVPNVSGIAMEDAIGILSGLELQYEIAPKSEEFADLNVVDQFPREGETVRKNSVVTLYYE